MTPGIVPGSSVIGGVPWVLDGEINVSGVSSTTYTLSDEYDQVLVEFLSWDDSNPGSLEQINLTVNGVTSGYDYQLIDGSTTTGSSAVKIAIAGNSEGRSPSCGNIRMSGKWSRSWSFVNGLASRGAGIAGRGQNTSITGPLSQFTIEISTGTLSVQARVYGVSY